MRQHCYCLLLLIILFIGLVPSVQAQFEINPNKVDIIANVNESQHEIKVNITNISTEIDSFYWSVSTAPDWPAEWIMFICDNNLCYNKGVYKCPDNQVNVLNPGQTLEFKITLVTGGHMDTSSVKLHLYDEKGCQGEFFTSEDGIVTVGNVSSSEEVETLHQVVVFPNPATNHLYLRNGKVVRNIAIINSSGNLVYQGVYSDTGIEVSNLPNGVYQLKMILANGVTKSLPFVRIE